MRCLWVCSCVLLTLIVADMDTTSELREKTTLISAELEGYKNAVAGLSPRLKGLILKEVEASQTCVSSSIGGACVAPDKKKMSKGVDVAIDVGEGWNNGEKKIHLNNDFNCPTGDDTDTWIESIKVNTINNADYLNTGEVYEPEHFIVPQGSNRRRVKFGKSDGSDLKDTFYQGDNDKMVSNWRWIPSTNTVMRRKDADNPRKYHDGDFQKAAQKELVDDFESTNYWEIDGGDCIAMAAYIGAKIRNVNGNSNGYAFMKNHGDKFNNEVHLRTMKFSLCKLVGTLPKCAVRKTVVSCWYKDASNNWHQCKDNLFTASIMSRS